MTDTAPGTTGQGTEAPGGTAAALTTPAPAAAPAAAPTAPSWLQGADELTVGYVQNKGWSEPTQVLESYRNLEKLFGADKAGNTVILPKPDATPEELGKFYDRLGRPATPADYKLQMPEGADPAFAKTAAEWFHKHGASAKQAEGIAAEWNGYIAEQKAQHEQQKLQAFQDDDRALKTEWGAAFQQNLTAAQAAARGLGLSTEVIDKLQDAMGHKATMDLLYKIGSRMGEADFVTGDKTEKFGAAMTPAQAKAAIKSRMDDKNFVARYLSKDAEATAEMQRLHAFAYPEEG